LEVQETVKRPFVVKLLLFCAALIASVQVSAQDHGHHSEATESRVVELEEFHSVIFRVWHEAWPDEDYALLRELLPEIEQGAKAVAEAELPGILRHKQEEWDTGVAELQAVVKKYKQAAEGNQDKALLNAAEELHSQFEALARMIRPILPEIEDFHTSLYKLYHHYLPEYSLEKIRGSAKELPEKMAALNDATLPGRYKEIAEDFDAARSALTKSVQAFVAAVETENKAKITAAVEQLHTDYRTLQTLCE
jgi:hypothetical protein